VEKTRGDADDLPPTFFGKLLHDTRADHDSIVERVAVLPELASHCFVDDHHGGGQAVVAVGEGSPPLDGNFEYVEVARRHCQPRAAAMERTFLERTPPDAAWQPVAPFERHAASGGRAFNTRDRLETLDTITQQLLYPGGLQVLRTGQRHDDRAH